MPFYVQKGNIPSKRHIQHYINDDRLCYEEHMSREGFSDIYSNVYHINPPTAVAKIGTFRPLTLKAADDRTHRHHHLQTFNIKAQGNWVMDRSYLAFNQDVVLSFSRPVEDADFFYKNGSADEVIYIHHGKGIMKSQFGDLRFGDGDYIVVPRGIIFKLEFETSENLLLVIESRGAVNTPKRYRNKHGQLLEHAPFSERDIRVPEFVDAIDASGEFKMHLRLQNGMQEYDLAHHPFDFVGWDGYFYPWIFNINDFMPITGKIHQPPTVHQTFEGYGFVICSFVPRLFDYHEKSIPSPYAHSNLESDEVIYYAAGNFVSRKGMSEGSITVHPQGIPHGPQPGRYEGSIGKKSTDELAVMLDTFRPLLLTETAMQIDDASYPYSWLEQK